MSEMEYKALDMTFDNSEDAKVYLIYKNPQEFKDYILKLSKKGLEGKKLTLKQIRELGAYYCGTNNVEVEF